MPCLVCFCGRPAISFWEKRDYAKATAENFYVLNLEENVIAAMANAAEGDVMPAERHVNPDVARMGAEMFFRADEPLRKSLLGAGILYIASDGMPAVSFSEFRKVFVDMAYVFVTLPPEQRRGIPLPFYTCDVFGIQQHCPHTNFVRSLKRWELPAPHISFEDIPTSRQRGRPRGKAKTESRRLHSR